MKLHSQILKFSNSQILFAVLVWSLLILRYGYRFGTGDHVEYLPYVLYLNDHSLFAHDYFLQGLIEKVPNERSVVCNFLSLFRSHLESACFILHFLTTVTLIVGLQKLSEVFTQNILVIRIAILINFLLLFDRGLGNVELYSDAVQGSSISVAIISFALYYFFRNKFITSSVLMSIASIIHPVEGLTVFMVMGATLLFLTSFKKFFQKRLLVKFMLIYALSAGAFITLLLVQKFDRTSIPDQEMFFRIYEEFRHAHHYMFSYFPLIEKCLFAFFILIIVCEAYFSKGKLFWFTVFALIGTLFYIFFTDVLHQPQIASLQFYKVTQWIKFFAVLILVKSFFRLGQGNVMNGFKKYFNSSVAIAAVIAISILTIKPDFIERGGIYHQYGKDWKRKNDMVEISMQINKTVDKNAVFVQPFGCTELKYFGKVSSWVDWKAFVKDQSKIQEWYRRIGIVYGITINDKEKGFELSGKADSYFYHLDGSQLEEFKKEGVTHLLTLREFPPSIGSLILSNNTYAVYQL